jgi:PAS domain S-box-containing protein
MNFTDNLSARVAELEAEVQSLRAQLAENGSLASLDTNAAAVKDRVLAVISDRADRADARSAMLAADNAELVADSAFMKGILESSNDCIKVLSLEGELLFMSGGGRRVMEVDDFETIRGCQWPTFWPGEGGIKAAEAIDSARNGKAAFFEGPAPTAKGSPRYWEVYVVPIFEPDGSVARILSISRDITERHRSQQQRDVLARELHHRVNNTLAIVSAITTQSIRAAASLQEAELSIAGRIRALAKAHTMLVDEKIILTTVADVIKSSIAPYDEGTGRITAEGPDVSMSSRPSISLALAINELATNATKYGSLSVSGGHVTVKWTVTDEKLRLVWTEIGGPAVAAPQRKSFGTTLIRSTFSGHMGGSVNCNFEPLGVECMFEVPLAALIEEA